MRDLPHPSLHRSWVEIDLRAIADNVRFFRELAGPGVHVMPAVKADAYGHGAVVSARAALAGGADRLAVASCLEGQELREAGIGVPIQVLGAILPEEARTAVRLNLTLSLHETHIARLVSLEAVAAGRAATVQLKIDTGMGRLGILPERLEAAAREVAGLPGLILEGAFMHFADAADPEYSRLQLERFSQASAQLEAAGLSGLIRHAASTSPAILYPESRLDLVRPGAGVYGYASPAGLSRRCGLKPAMAWKSAIVQVKDYPAGSCLGYNRTFIADRPMRVAVLPVGYADGYRREGSNRAQILIRGKRAPVVGMVSMDYIMADVTGFGELNPGSVATLLGRDGEDRISAEDLAEWGNTIPYCLTTGLGKRPGRLIRPL
jgi:alanine racemase